MILRTGRRALQGALVDHAPAALIVAFLLCGAVLLAGPGGIPILGVVDARSIPDFLNYSALATLLVWLVVLIVDRVRAVGRARRSTSRPPPFGAFLGRTLVRRSHRSLSALGAGLLLATLMPAFLGYKNAIPLLQPYGSWDPVFEAMDLRLHGGLHPWEILHPLLGRPAVTLWVDRAYSVWFTVGPLGLIGLTFLLSGRARGQLLLAFTATWAVLGIGVATAFSSVGPAFLGTLVPGGEAYRELMTYLEAVHVIHPLEAIHLQDRLAAALDMDPRPLASGIAAMPSLHVAIPVLYALAAWRRFRVLSLLLMGFGLVILAGSVHLGWHYAVDGYVSILMVPVIWWSAGVAVDRWRGWVGRARDPVHPSGRSARRSV